MFEKDFQKEIEQVIERMQGQPLEAINAALDKLSDAYNHRGQDSFDGLSPIDMRGVLYGSCNENMVKIKDERGADLPVIQQITYYLNLVAEQKEIKLTQSGYLPPKIVQSIYAQKYLSDRRIELYPRPKILKENDSDSVRMTHVVPLLAGLAKIRNHKISLTKLGKKALETGNMLSLVLPAYVEKLNWAYFDYVSNPVTEKVGQLGAYYSMYLLHKYGGQKRPVTFYTDKYFKAFPDLYSEEYWTTLYYTRRTFDKFFTYFGFLEKYDENIHQINMVKKTPAFDRCIGIQI